MTAPAEYLVRYGSAYLNRFRNIAGLVLERGARVVIESERGRELGEVLGPADEALARRVADVPAGDLTGAASAANVVAGNELELRAHGLLELATEQAAEAGLPLAVLDVEVLLDGQAFVHAVHWDECDATPLFARLGAESGLSVKLLDLTRQPVAAEPKGCGADGCGSGGCGSGGCGEKGGCSSGGCSRGAVKSADELTAYFADLRKQMEHAGLVRTPLL